jgi:hypothetical protein
MKKSLILTLSAMLVGLFAPMASAAGTHETEATVHKVAGNVQARLPGQMGTVAATPGMKLPQGTVITTGSNSQVELETISGSLSSIQANSTVGLEELSITTDNSGAITAQTAQLDLKSGNIASTLDPINHAINHYSVRTPRGVAMARGTAYTVTVTETGTTVATLSGTVVLTPTDGGTPIVIDIGTGVVISGPGNVSHQSLTALVAAEKAHGTAGNPDSITHALDAMVQTVADAVTSGTFSGSGATTLLASVVKVASQGNPANAVDYVRTTAVAGFSAVTSNGFLDTNKLLDAFHSIAAVTESGINGILQGLGFSGATILPSSISTPITPIDPTVVSPSGGNH